MRFTPSPLARVLLAFVLAASAALAEPIASPPIGQSFTAAANGQVKLDTFTFAYTAGTVGFASTTLYILSAAPANQNGVTTSANLLFASSTYTDALNNGGFSGLDTRTWSFSSGATLDGGVTYYAFFATGQNFRTHNGDAIGDGHLFLSNDGTITAVPGNDAISSVGYSAVPEPGTWAALAGAAALGLAWWRRARAA